MKRHTPIRIRLFVLLFVFLLVAPGAFARIRPSRQQIQLEINHGQKLDITIDNSTPPISGQVLTGDVEDNSFDLTHESKAQVVIKDANPLLYKYEIRDKEEKLLASAEALEKLAKSVAELQGSLNSFAGLDAHAARFIDAGPAPSCDGREVECFAELAETVLSAVNEIDQVLIDSESDRAAMQRTVAGWDVDTWQKQYDALAPKLPRVAVAAARVARTAAETARQSATVQNLEATARAQAVVSDANLAVGLRGDVEEALKKLATVKRLSAQVGTDMPLDEAFAIDRSHSQSFTVRVAKTEDFPKELKTVRFTGDRKLRVQPYEAAPVRLVPAMVYSRVENPTYEAKAEDDHFVVTETKKEFTGIDLAAALEIAPRALDFATWNGVVQVGIAPQKDIGFFLGAGLQVQELFTLGAGIAYQRVNVLGDGLTPGQSIVTEDLLKVDKRYDSGIYFFITTAKKK